MRESTNHFAAPSDFRFGASSSSRRTSLGPRKILQLRRHRPGGKHAAHCPPTGCLPAKAGRAGGKIQIHRDFPREQHAEIRQHAALARRQHDADPFLGNRARARCATAQARQRAASRGSANCRRCHPPPRSSPGCFFNPRRHASATCPRRRVAPRITELAEFQKTLADFRNIRLPGRIASPKATVIGFRNRPAISRKTSRPDS